MEDQRDVCISSLREEFGSLRNSLIVIVSGETFGVLDSPATFPKWVPHWNKDYDSQTGVWSVADLNSGNLYIHGYHPRYAVKAAFGDRH